MNQARERADVVHRGVADDAKGARGGGLVQRRHELAKDLEDQRDLGAHAIVLLRRVEVVDDHRDLVVSDQRELQRQGRLVVRKLLEVAPLFDRVDHAAAHGARAERVEGRRVRRATLAQPGRRVEVVRDVEALHRPEDGRDEGKRLGGNGRDLVR